MEKISGKLDSSALRIGLVVSQFNGFITEKLLQGALEIIMKTGGREENITILHVPGSFEIPVAAQALAETGRFDALICLGCLIRGETAHFDYIAMEATRGIDEVALRYKLPVTYGLLTTDTVDQALSRAGLKFGNKGMEAATAAIELATALKSLNG